MNDFIYFTLAEEPTAEQMETVEELREAFIGMGLWMKLSHSKDCSDGKAQLIISFERSRYDEHRSRGAGRYKKQLKDYQRVTVGEVRTKLADRSAEEVASELGVSRSTLFRRIRDKSDDERF